MKLWLARDPETGRVQAQTWPTRDVDFPPGARGRGWERRTVDVEEDVWQRMLRAEYPPQQQDELHLAWWQAGQ